MKQRRRRCPEREGLELFALRDPLLELLDKDPVFLYGFPPRYGQGHWNETGNRVAGRLIAEHVCRNYSASSEKVAM